ncbi:MAG: L-threonine 3-dehydrogenase [Alphaproteobacteria bacterium]|nr:L-threonine 3-dehydrogenase [Alphaproteobacteria bacterium]MBO6864095.1 L-threonine 3-dehydrogenase [Alphaproteobacteria bacterium]
MRAIYKSKRETGLWLGSADAPKPGPRDVLIRVQRAAICGTDLHIYNWDSWAQKTIPVPMIVGHEYCGIVEAVGEEVTLVKVGQRVSGEGHLVCGHCRNCRGGREHLCINTVGVGVNRQGAFADLLTIPEHNVFAVPEDIPDDVVAILDPLGNAVHTALSYDLVGEDVLITGAGPIGLMAAAVCRHVGARHVVVTDLSDDRLRLAESMGATRGVRADKEPLKDVMRELGMTEGFDVGLEMSGAASAMTDMINAMNHGGKIALLGLFSKPVEIDMTAAIFKGLQFKGVYGREMFETWYKMVSMLQTGLDVTPVITHRLPFEKFEDGFAALNSGRACKVVLDLAA